ncbi:mannosyltransferase putative-domain-containing protein [Xylariomycetidae sp. FL2044]|nr:mannosyltransferase putative-domain-containing protein [Xylariomycetidae sp. FL2044]
MRLVWRVLVLAVFSIATALFFFVFPDTTPHLRALLTHHPSVPAAVTTTTTTTTTEDPATSVIKDPKKAPDSSNEAIGAFWRKWSQIMYEARPRIDSGGGGGIQLLGSANTLRPAHPDAPRLPYHDLVRNSAESLQDAVGRPHARFVEQLRAAGELQPGSGSGGDDGSDGTSGIFRGRGVVMVGGGEYFGPAVVGIHMLRRTGSDLPVEVFVTDDAEYEPRVCEDYLPRLNARCRVLAHVLAAAVQHETPPPPPLLPPLKHYQLKAQALLFSSFAEVVLLDSDSIPLVDPATEILDAKPYTVAGLMVWPDLWAATESPKFWALAWGKKKTSSSSSSFPAGLPATSSESGQLVIDKRTHLAPLLLATYYNVFGDDVYYPLLSQGALGQGDKETFMAAAVALGAPYHRVRMPADVLGRHDGREFRGTAMVQFLARRNGDDDADDGAVRDDDDKQKKKKRKGVRPAFLHANTPKMNAGHLVDEGDLLSTEGGGGRRLRLLGSEEDQKRLFGFDLESAIWDVLVQTGCELADVIREWRDRERLCERLEEHHRMVFHDG